MKKTILILLTMTAAASAQNIYVDDDAVGMGSGTITDPYRTVEQAVNQSNGLSTRATIWVAPGTYRVDNPIPIERTVVLRGSTVLVKDTYGPTGVIQSGETRIVGTSSLGARPLITVGKSGQVISNVEIRDLVLAAEAAIGGVLELKRVQNAYVHDNLLLGTTNLAFSTPGLSTYATSGVLQNLYMSGLLGGAFLSGGYATSPANLSVLNIRAMANRNGILLVGTSDGITEPGNQLTVSLVNSEMSNNTGNVASTGLRLLVKGNEALGNTGLSNSTITASMSGNRIVGNTIGLVVDAGFPYRLVPPAANNVCDNRTFRGTITASFAGTTTSGNLTPSMITTGRLQQVLGATPISQWQYLHNSNFTISDSNGAFANVQITKPFNDPYTGPCPNDTTQEALNDLLILNGMIK